MISIHGKHLHVGSKIQIFVGDQECHLLETNSTSLATPSDEETIRCRTSKLADHSEQWMQSMPRLVKREALWNGTITILIDNYTETYSNISYAYTEVKQCSQLGASFDQTLLSRIRKCMSSVDMPASRVGVYRFLFVVSILIRFKHPNSFSSATQMTY